jgi:hypothetical protein
VLKWADLIKRNGVYVFHCETNSWLKFIVYGGNEDKLEVIMLNEVHCKLYPVPETFKTDDNNFKRVNSDFKLKICYSGFSG